MSEEPNVGGVAVATPETPVTPIETTPAGGIPNPLDSGPTTTNEAQAIVDMKTSQVEANNTSNAAAQGENKGFFGFLKRANPIKVETQDLSQAAAPAAESATPVKPIDGTSGLFPEPAAAVATPPPIPGANPNLDMVNNQTPKMDLVTDAAHEGAQGQSVTKFPEAGALPEAAATPSMESTPPSETPTVETSTPVTESEEHVADGVATETAPVYPTAAAAELPSANLDAPQTSASWPGGAADAAPAMPETPAVPTFSNDALNPPATEAPAAEPVSAEVVSDPPPPPVASPTEGGLPLEKVETPLDPLSVNAPTTPTNPWEASANAPTATTEPTTPAVEPATPATPTNPWEAPTPQASATPEPTAAPVLPESSTPTPNPWEAQPAAASVEPVVAPTLGEPAPVTTSEPVLGAPTSPASPDAVPGGLASTTSPDAMLGGPVVPDAGMAVPDSSPIAAAAGATSSVTEEPQAA